MPFGAEVRSDGVRFRIYAPAAQQIRLLLTGRDEPLALQRDPDGWHELITAEATAGSRYQYLLPDGTTVPDPASRFQPEDVGAPCEVIDPAAYPWHDAGWTGRPWNEAVLYELHVGAFTQEGTFGAAARRLDHLSSLGITAVELMSLSDFPGLRNWGYDAVLPFAPDSSYGRPEDLKAFIDAAHARGIMVLLDVVYNHFGPEGNYLARYFPQICSPRHDSSWGKAMNFDGEGSDAVRTFFIENALYWLEEFHIDGLRLDASHEMKDESSRHILDELADRMHAAAGSRPIHLILEDEKNVSQRLMRSHDGTPLCYTAQWNQDMSHLLSAAFGNVCADRDPQAEETGRLAEMLAHGYVLPSSAQDHAEEIVCKVPPNAYIAFTQTHDLVGNRIDTQRLHQLVPSQASRAVTAIVLLLPQTPMLFMGEEWNATALFPYFSDYHGDLGDRIVAGREEFLKGLHHASDEEVQAAPNPQADSTFRSAQLQWDELDKPHHAEMLDWYRGLLAVRHQVLSPLLKGIGERCGRPQVHAPGALTIAWKLTDQATLRLAANLCNESRNGFPPQEGRTIWIEGTAPATDHLGPWSVRWCLA